MREPRSIPGPVAPTLELPSTTPPQDPSIGTEETLVPDPVRLGDETGRYELLEPVGEGAMATIHRATDLDLNRTVAFKMLKSSTSPSARRRLLQEVALTARLDHPGILPVYGLQSQPDGRIGYAMKLVTGRTLRELVETARHQHRTESGPDRGHDLDARLGVFLQVCRALAYAHSKGVIHRDIKPDNIMLGSFGEVFLMDWGIARQVGPGQRSPSSTAEAAGEDEDTTNSRHTQVGQVFGTIAYMAPEQARGETDRVDVRTDVFAMGLLLYELLLLRRAYDAEGKDAQLAQARNARLSPWQPAERCPPAHPALIAIGRKATRPDPEDRYPTIQALADDLERYQRGEATLALPDNLPRAMARFLVHRQWLLLTLLAAALPLGAFAVATTWSLQQARMHNQALLAQNHQMGLAEHQREVSSRGQVIESHLLWVEGQLEGIAAAAEYAWIRGTPLHRPTWSAADYTDPTRAPTGLVDSAAYGKPISLEHAVYTVAPGTEEPIWRDDLARADGLRELLFTVVQDQPQRGQSSTSERPLPGEGPIVWAYVALERSGLMYMVPGARGWDDRYDPRTRPWYRTTVGKDGNVWGKPYVDLMGQGGLLSATRALTTSEGQFLGVAGVDLRFEQVIQTLVAAEDLPGFRTAWLVDADGLVMVESTAKDTRFIMPATEKLDPGLDFGRIRHAAVARAAPGGRAGQLELDEDGSEVLVTWTALPSIGWLYGVEVELSPWMRGTVSR